MIRVGSYASKIQTHKIASFPIRGNNQLYSIVLPALCWHTGSDALQQSWDPMLLIHSSTLAIQLFVVSFLHSSISTKIPSLLAVWLIPHHNVFTFTYWSCDHPVSACITGHLIVGPLKLITTIALVEYNPIHFGIGDASDYPICYVRW